ncbi:MAG: ZIP family transporter [Promethearchaeota archaeon]
MEQNVLIAFITIGAISTVSLVGVLFISMKREKMEKILFVLIAYATGTILASALLDLIPEALHHAETLVGEGLVIDEKLPFLFISSGFFAFFILERFLYWFHGHVHTNGGASSESGEGRGDEGGGKDGGDHTLVCEGRLPESISDGSAGEGGDGGSVKNFAKLNLIGDAIHNFLDGVIIMVGFRVNVPAGLVIMIAVFFHELPQEIGDFGILIYGGFTRKTALLFNFASALVSVAGGFFAFIFTGAVGVFNMFFLSFSGGGFLYIASAELLPELLKERNLKKSIIQAIIFMAGFLSIYLLLELLPHA